MSETQNAVTTREQRRALLTQQAKAIDEAAAGAMELFHGAEVSTEKELLLAMAVVDLRAALTPEVMQPIMSLMNSPLGFLTDKDPAKPSKNDAGQWVEPKPYSVETVRDCVISAKMLGFRVVGNEMNIIAGKFYPAKNGFRRKLTDGKSFPGMSDFRDSYEPPRMAAQGALVKCKATWVRHGKPDSFEAEFAIRNNAGMGADAILGKAERKLCKRVHDILLGMSTPDIEDEVNPTVAATKTANATVVVRTSDASDDQVPGAEVPPVRNTAPPEAATQTSGEGSAQAASAPRTDPQPAQTTTQAASSGRLASVRKWLQEAGVAEGAVVTHLHKMFPECGGCNSLDEVEQMFPNIINAVSRPTSKASLLKALGGDK